MDRLSGPACQLPHASFCETASSDPSHLTVAGEGTGGTLATVTTLLAKERGGPPIDFQVLLYPVTDADFETPSYREFGFSVILCAG
ncbi:hypothetical protein KSF_102960 [Reticulibacter mediterranei]|uniref:Alpha/beta hydrolase fold-3 domain-containing protein n=1 Tax=Reticulibacter mediterranei TaxID=2778369 RepID=A0A8J3ITJ5_9CHLR|nr:alpha/beta hydrolase fold domain-containing protein [Reticulibacter mediterranei]GHP00249.1 hypothetical protein KSF_102960 [Reticulibacter mediterranei]